MTIGTLYFTHSARSCSSRSFDLCTIWLTAKGAAGRSGFVASWAASSSVISASHSSSWSSGRAFSAGNEPTMPALHCAITSGGCEMMNSGEATTGKSEIVFQDGRQRHRVLPQFDVCVNVSPNGWAAGRQGISRAP